MSGRSGRSTVLPWFYGWNIVAAGVIIQGTTFGIGFSSFTFWVLPWLGAFETYSVPGMGEYTTGRKDIFYAITASTLAIGAMSPWFGNLLDRVSLRIPILIGAVVFTIGLCLVAMAESLTQIIAIYTLVLSPSFVLCGPLAMATMVAKWFRGRRGLALGVVSTGTSLGAMIFPPIVTTLLSYEGGWRDTHFVLAGVSAVILFPLIWLVVRTSPDEMGVAPEPESEHSERVAAQFSGRQWDTGSILQERTFWITVAAFLPLNLILAGVQNNLGPFAQDLSIDQQHASLFVSVLGFAMLLGKLLYGSLSDRVDHRLLYWSAAALFAGCLLIMVSLPSYTLMLVACAMIGFGMGANLPVTGAIVATRFGPQAFGRVTGLVYLFLTISAIGSVVAGDLRDRYGSYETTFELFLVLLVPAVVAMIFLPKVRRPGPAADAD